MTHGVIGNTSDFGSEESGFEPLWVNKKAAYCGFFVAWGRALELPVVTGIPVGISGSSHTQQEPIVLQEVKVVIERERRGVTALRLAFLAFIISMIN